MFDHAPSSRRGLRALATAAVLALGATGTALAGDVDKNLGADGLALEGYDPVAYFTEGEPTKGSADYTATHDGATYRFANAAHLAAFEADPDKYAPAYGGYCAFGLAMGQKVGSDPEVWEIVDGQLADHNWNVVADVPAERLKDETPEGVRLGAAE
jgi:YHS domain-containing protein